MRFFSAGIVPENEKKFPLTLYVISYERLAAGQACGYAFYGKKWHRVLSEKGSQWGLRMRKSILSSIWSIISFSFFSLFRAISASVIPVSLFLYGIKIKPGNFMCKLRR
jgi:hypothetical protein